MIFQGRGKMIQLYRGIIRELVQDVGGLYTLFTFRKGLLIPKPWEIQDKIPPEGQ